jgi:hypothetical protein
MSTLSAPPGTYLLAATKTAKGRIEVERHVIVGFVHGHGALAFPLLVLNKDEIKGHKAVLHPEGEVTDGAFLATYQDMDSWLAEVEKRVPNLQSKDAPRWTEPASTKPLDGVKSEEDLLAEADNLPPLGPPVGSTEEGDAEARELTAEPVAATTKPVSRKRTRKPKDEPTAAPASTETDDDDYSNLI